jgi:hypothetical protein
MLRKSTKKSNLVDILLAKTRALEKNVLFPLLVLYLRIMKRSMFLVFIL